MVTRIATASANQALVQRMLEQQVRVNDDQNQVSTGFKSQDYIGISGDSYQLLDIENERARLQRYQNNNDLTNTTLTTQQQAVQGIDTAARTFQSAMIQFASQDLTSKSPSVVSAVADIQQKAFDTLSQMQYFLNQQVDGKYIFGGATNTVPPVSLPYSNLQDFQNFYDGIGTVFPSTRVANLVDIGFNNVTANYINSTVPSTSQNVTQVQGQPGNFITQTLDQTQTGNLIFSNVGSNGKVTASTPNAFRSLQVGQTIMINNSASAQGGATATDNNGVYTITEVSPDGSSITLDQTVNAGTELAADNVAINLTVPNGTTLALSGSTAGNNGAYTVVWPSNADLAAMGFNLNGAPPDLVTGDSIFTSHQIPVNSAAPETISLKSNAFLHGTSIATTTKVSDTQTMKMDVTALDPAFEKVMRALGMMAQGDLIDHPERVQQALAVINDGVAHSPLEPTEAQSDLQSVQDRIANNIAVLTNAKDTQNQFLAFLEGRQNDLSKADTTEAAVRLQTDSQTLQVSFASLAKISQLSLLNYL